MRDPNPGACARSATTAPRLPRAAALLLGALLALLLLSGCGDDEDPSTVTAAQTTAARTAPEPAPLALDGRTFVSDGLTGRELVAGSEVVLRFEDGGMGAVAGCNTLGGAYRVSEGRLAWNAAPATTMMACDRQLEAQDDWLTGFLSSGVRVRLDGQRLTLAGEDETLTLTEATGPVGQPPLVGTRWELVAIARGDRRAPVPAGVKPPTLLIGRDGRALVFTGCNGGSAPVEVRDDGFLDFGPLVLTRMACAGAADRLERAVVAILDGRVAAGLGDPALTLSKDGRQLQFRVAG